MSRHESYYKILEATAKIQHNISIILEAQAMEAEKSHNLIVRHINQNAFLNQQHLLDETLGIHKQLVAVIDGLTKMETGLARNLKVILNRDEKSSSDLGDFDLGDFEL